MSQSLPRKLNELQQIFLVPLNLACFAKFPYLACFAS